MRDAMDCNNEQQNGQISTVFVRLPVEVEGD
jgi:hypothetical protein